MTSESPPAPRHPRLAAVFVIAALLAALLATSSAPAADPTPPGRIAFSLLPDVETGLGTVRPDGSGRRIISRQASGARWSPNGKRLIAHGSGGFTVLDPRGRRLETLRVDGVHAFLPEWSPDGRRVAAIVECCTSARRPGWCADLWALRADGRGTRLLVSAGLLDGPYGWSPDGQLLAYSGSPVPVLDGQPAYNGIVLVSSRNGRKSAPDSLRGGEAPTWSPDGRRFAFVRRDAAGRTDLYVADREGRDVRPLTRNGRSSDAAWSPDGTSMALIESTADEHRYAVVVVNVARGRSHRVAEVGGRPRLVWSPDARWLAWSDYYEPVGQDHVFVARADGVGAPRPITPGVDPDWR